MRPKAWFLYALALTVVLAGQAPGQGVAWQQDLQTAQQMAAQSNRLVLIHFGAPWCEACHRMERETLADPAVCDAIRADFVAVGLNVDHHRVLARQYGVNALPTDVVVTPQGQLIDRQVGYVPRADYAARLAQIVTATRRPPMATNVPGAPGAGPMGPAAPAGPYAPPANYGYNNVPPSAAPVQPFGPPPTINGGSPPPSLTQPSFSPPAQPLGAPTPSPSWAGAPAPYAGPAGPALPPANPPMMPQEQLAPLGLDGFCPVELVERKTWTPGNEQWNTVFAGRRYLFAGPQQQQAFLANPDRYSPINSGVDVVLQFDRGQVVSGQRRHGVFFADRIFLFASEDSLQAFAREPARYENALRQAAEQARRPVDYR